MRFVKWRENSNIRNIPVIGAPRTEAKKPDMPPSIKKEGENAMDGNSQQRIVPYIFPIHAPTVRSGYTVPPGSPEPEENIEKRYFPRRRRSNTEKIVESSITREIISEPPPVMSGKK